MMPELMTLDEIAEMWRCSRRHAGDVLVKSPGFPAPAPGSGPKHRVWLASDVRKFARGKPAQNPHNTLQAA